VDRAGFMSELKDRTTEPAVGAARAAEETGTTIVRVEVRSTRIAVTRPHQMAIGTTTFQENVVVKLTAADGTIGYGEAPHMVGHSQRGETPDTVRVVLRRKLIPAALGRDAMSQEGLSQALAKAVPGNLRAKGALVMAAYDLAGRSLGTPVYNLLGGCVRDRIPLSWSLPIVDTDAVVEEGLRMVERGWRILKVKIGRPEPLDDAAVVLALREAVGDGVDIRADANQAYDAKTAISVIRRMEEASPGFIEQPVHRDDVEGMAEVRAAVGVPVMADEGAETPEDVVALWRARAADSISIYVIGPGGLDRSKRMASIAEACRLRAYVGGALESAIGASAGLHLAASSPSIDLGCEMSGQYLLTDDLATKPIPMEDGALLVPQGPGLGISVDEEKLNRYGEGDSEFFEIS
jgi:muconate cycloisomerase